MLASNPGCAKMAVEVLRAMIELLTGDAGRKTHGAGRTRRMYAPTDICI